MSLRPTVDFLLYDWLKADRLSERTRFADHSRETFDAVLDTCERIAREKYAPHNRLVDTEEPRTVTEPDGSLRVVLPAACSRWACSAALPWPAASLTKWASARCSRCPSC